MIVPVSARTGRRGFTLIELLVVMAILGVLIGLTAMAVSGVARSQAIATTQTNMQKLTSELDKLWKAAGDTALDEYKAGKMPSELVTLKVTDPDRAKKVWLRLRMMQEFPHNFVEASQGVRYTDVGADNTYGTPDDVQYPTAGRLPPKPNYFRVIAGTDNTLGTGDDKNLGGDLYAESSACAYLALTTSRRGVIASPEDAIGPSSMKSVNAGGGGTMTIFLDAWDKPLSFQHAETPPQWDAYRYQWVSGGTDKIFGNTNDLTSRALRQVGARGDQ